MLASMTCAFPPMVLQCHAVATSAVLLLTCVIGHWDISLEECVMQNMNTRLSGNLFCSQVQNVKKYCQTTQELPDCPIARFD